MRSDACGGAPRAGGAMQVRLLHLSNASALDAALGDAARQPTASPGEALLTSPGSLGSSEGGRHGQEGAGAREERPGAMEAPADWGPGGAWPRGVLSLGGDAVERGGDAWSPDGPRPSLAEREPSPRRSSDGCGASRRAGPGRGREGRRADRPLPSAAPADPLSHGGADLVTTTEILQRLRVLPPPGTVAPHLAPPRLRQPPPRWPLTAAASGRRPPRPFHRCPHTSAAACRPSTARFRPARARARAARHAQRAAAAGAGEPPPSRSTRAHGRVGCAHGPRGQGSHAGAPLVNRRRGGPVRIPESCPPHLVSRRFRAATARYAPVAALFAGGTFRCPAGSAAEH